MSEREASITGDDRLEIEDGEMALDAHPELRRWKRLWVVGVGLAGLALACSFVGGMSLRSTSPALVFGLLIAIASFATRRIARQQLVGRRDSERALHVSVRETGFRVVSDSGDQYEVMWSSVQGFVLVEGGVVLIRLPLQYVLPRRAFSEEGFAEVVATVRRNVAPWQPKRPWAGWLLGLAIGLALGAYAVWLVH